MSGDHNQYQKPTSKYSLQVEAMKLALEALEVVPIPPAKGRRALEAAMETLRQAIEQVEKDQAEFEELVTKVQELEKQACEIIRNDKEIKDWEAIAADQAMTIAMLKSEQEPVGFNGLTELETAQTMSVRGLSKPEWVGLTDDPRQYKDLCDND